MNKPLLLSSLMVVALGLAAPLAQAAGKVTSDLLPPQKRQAAVDLADKLIHREPPAPLPVDMPSPFNPIDFDKPDPSEVPVPTAPRPTVPAPSGAAPTAAAVAAPAGPASDRETLEMLASRLIPTGTFVVNGKPILFIERNRFEVGTKFIVNLNNQDYELELASIDRTTFTLRYRGEEITRPIKPVR